jgi:ferredoxin
MSATIILVILGLVVASVIVLWLFGERWRLLRPSTWQRMRTGGVGLDALHAYVYGRWTNQYVGFLVHWFFPRSHESGKKWLSDHYHGKVLTEEEAEAIIRLQKDIPLRDLEQIIPYPMARDLVLKGPPDVVAYECACRHARANPCQPTQVCMVVGRPGTDFVLEHNPQSSRRLTQTEALELLRAEHERGHLHSAWFKDAMLNRFYAICNCCSCCCGGVEAMTRYGIPMMASSGYIAEIDQELCDLCGACVDACPFNALSAHDTRLERNWELCMGCGVCEVKCPIQAISLVRDDKKGIPLDVRTMV